MPLYANMSLGNSVTQRDQRGSWSTRPRLPSRCMMRGKWVVTCTASRIKTTGSASRNNATTHLAAMGDSTRSASQPPTTMRATPRISRSSGSPSCSVRKRLRSCRKGSTSSESEHSHNWEKFMTRMCSVMVFDYVFLITYHQCSKLYCNINVAKCLMRS